MTEEPKSALDLRLEKKDEIQILNFIGRFDLMAVNKMEKIFERLIQPGALICLDFDRLEYLTSSGIGSLMAGVKKCREREAHMLVVNARPQVQETLELLGAHRLLEFFSDRGRGIQKLRSLAAEQAPE